MTYHIAIFTALKKHEEVNVSEFLQLTNLSTAAAVPLQELWLYVSPLVELGLVEYSNDRLSIRLTEEGKQRAQLFDRNSDS